MLAQLADLRLCEVMSCALLSAPLCRRSNYGTVSLLEARLLDLSCCFTEERLR